MVIIRMRQRDDINPVYGFIQQVRFYTVSPDTVNAAASGIYHPDLIVYPDDRTVSLAYIQTGNIKSFMSMRSENQEHQTVRSRDKQHASAAFILLFISSCSALLTFRSCPACEKLPSALFSHPQGDTQQ